MLVNSHQRSLDCAGQIQSTPYHSIFPKSILMLSSHLCLGPPSGLFPSGFSTPNLYARLFSPHACYMPCTSLPPRFNDSNNILQGVQIMKLLTVLFTSTDDSRHSECEHYVENNLQENERSKSEALQFFI
jgi:hypothetical protein